MTKSVHQRTQRGLWLAVCAICLVTLYGVWWCITWGVHPFAPECEGVIFLASLLNARFEQLPYSSRSACLRDVRVQYVRATISALTLERLFTGPATYPDPSSDEVASWLDEWYWPIVLWGFFIPLLIAGWSGLFFAGFIRVVVYWHIVRWHLLRRIMQALKLLRYLMKG